MPTSEVSFISAMKSLSRGGMTLLTACGTMMWRIDWPWLMPSERAASICPEGTASIPAR